MFGARFAAATGLLILTSCPVAVDGCRERTRVGSGCVKPSAGFNAATAALADASATVSCRVAISSCAAIRLSISCCCEIMKPTEAANNRLNVPTATGVIQRRNRLIDQRGSGSTRRPVSKPLLRPTELASTRCFRPDGSGASGTAAVSLAAVSWNPSSTSWQCGHRITWWNTAWNSASSSAFSAKAASSPSGCSDPAYISPGLSDHMGFQRCLELLHAETHSGFHRP